MLNLPIEIQDKIFLYLDYESLQNTRDFQSEYVLSKTKFCTYREAILDNNLENIKWLYNKDHIETNLHEDKGQYTRDYLPFEVALWDFIPRGTSDTDELSMDSAKVRYRKECIFLLVNAIKNGNQEIIKWILEHKYPDSEPRTGIAICACVYYNDLENAKFLFSQGFPININIAYLWCSENKNEEFVRWIHSGAISPNENHAVRAIRNSNMFILKVFLDIGLQMGVSMYNQAVMQREIEIIDWLQEVKCPINSSVMVQAVKTGKKDLMMKIYNIHQELTSESFEAAAEIGILENMKWLQDVKCPLSEETFNKAVLGGDLEIMEWLHSINCPINQNILQFAFLQGNIKNVEWLMNFGYKISREVLSFSTLSGNYDNAINTIRSLGHLIEQDDYEIIDEYSKGFFIDDEYYRGFSDDSGLAGGSWLGPNVGHSLTGKGLTSVSVYTEENLIDIYLEL